MAGLIRRVFLRQFTPLRPGAQHPKHTVQHRASIVPRTAPLIRPPRWPQHQFNHGPLFVVQFPVSCHGASRFIQSRPRIARNRSSAIYETGSSPFAGSPPVSNSARTASKSSGCFSRIFIFLLTVSSHNWWTPLSHSRASASKNEDASIVGKRRMAGKLCYLLRDLFNNRLREKMIAGLHVRNQSVEPILVASRIAGFSDSV